MDSGNIIFAQLDTYNMIHPFYRQQRMTSGTAVKGANQRRGRDIYDEIIACMLASSTFLKFGEKQKLLM